MLKLKDGQPVGYGPLGADPEVSVLAFLCEDYGIPWNDPDRFRKLALALAREFRKDALTAPGQQNLSMDERNMSIAHVVDQERDKGDTNEEAVERARARLVEYDLAEEKLKTSTLVTMFLRGQALLRKHGMEPWSRHPPGRPRTRDRNL